MKNIVFKRIISMMILTCLIIALCNIPSIPVQAAGRGDGADYLNTKVFSLNSSDSQTLNGNQLYFYEINLTSAGKVTFSLQSDASKSIYVYRSNSSHVPLIKKEKNWNLYSDQYMGSSSVINARYLYLQPGRYYVVVGNNVSAKSNYTLSIKYSAITETCPESFTDYQDTFEMAPSVKQGATVTGVCGFSDVDYYKISISNPGIASLTFNAWNEDGYNNYDHGTYNTHIVTLYNSSYQKVESWTSQYDSENDKRYLNVKTKNALAKGTYYIKIQRAEMTDYTFKYNFKLTQAPILVNKITLNKTSTTLVTDASKTVQLSATVAPSNATNKTIVWQSSNTKVATVSTSGLVTAVGSGKAVISAVAKDGSGITASCTVTVKVPGVQYRTHIQTYGWETTWKKNGQMSGTSGQSKRLEGIEIKLVDAPYSGSISYTTHIQTYGWETTWKKDGQMSGTSGQSKRLEGIKIKLTGEMADHYDVYYRVHAQTYGWLGWAKNGQMAGTSGLSRRLEAIQIVLVKKGNPAPGKTYQGITSVITLPAKTN